MQPLVDRIAKMCIEFAGSAVTATEPIFGYVADALGLKMRNSRLQLAVMNGTEPNAEDIAVFEKDLRSRSPFCSAMCWGSISRHFATCAR